MDKLFPHVLVVCLRLCPSGGAVSVSTMEVFGRPVAADQRVTSNHMTAVTGHACTSGPAVPYVPSHLHGVPVPHTEARLVTPITIDVSDDEQTLRVLL